MFVTVPDSRLYVEVTNRALFRSYLCGLDDMDPTTEAYSRWGRPNDLYGWSLVSEITTSSTDIGRLSQIGSHHVKVVYISIVSIS